VLYLRSATCDGTEVACEDDVAADRHDFKSLLEATALPPVTYYLYVDGSSLTSGTGHYRLDVTVAAAP
jgi:hypothetical protein